ncbi:MAG: hypothetical protein ACFFD5_02995 [Candidatus Thorarchaeota archaeon]
MMSIKKKILSLSIILSIVSIFTPTIFHIGSGLSFIYYFWSWGLIVFFGLNTSESGVYYNDELEFLIPAFLAIMLIIIGSLLILNGLRKNKSKNALIGSIITIIVPLLLSGVWQLIYTLAKGYPTFWGSYGGYNYYLPSFSIFLQFTAGLIALISLKVNVKYKSKET